MYFYHHHQWFEGASYQSRQFLINDWQIFADHKYTVSKYRLLYYILQPESTGHVNNIEKLYLDKKLANHSLRTA
jgi:hypothetical protein